MSFRVLGRKRTEVRTTRPSLVKRRRRLMKNRLFQMSRNRLRRTQLRVLRPFYCRVYRRMRIRSSIRALRFLVLRATRYKASCFRRGFSGLSTKGANQRGLEKFCQPCTRSSGLRQNLRVSAWVGGTRSSSVQKSRYFWNYRTAQGFRSARRATVRTLKRKIADIRTRALHNVNARLAATRIAYRFAMYFKGRVRLYREAKLRIRGRKFKKSGRPKPHGVEFNEELALPRREVRRGLRRTRRRRVFYRRLPPRRMFQYTLDVVFSQRARRRKRLALREFFIRKRSYATRILAALRYRLDRSNPKGWVGPKWRRRRRGRRMFSGLFGKRRYRIERRDKVTFKRVTRRFSIKRAAVLRTVHVHSKMLLTQRATARALRASLQPARLVLPTVLYATYGAALRTNLRRVVVNALAQRISRRSNSCRGRKLATKLANGRASLRVASVLLPLQTLEFKARKTHQRTLTRLAAFVAPRGRQVVNACSPQYRTWKYRTTVFKLALQRRLRGGRLSVGQAVCNTTGSVTTRQAIVKRFSSAKTQQRLDQQNYPVVSAGPCVTTQMQRNRVLAGAEFGATWTSEAVAPSGVTTVGNIYGFSAIGCSPAREALNVPTFLSRAAVRPGVLHINPVVTKLQYSVGARLQRLYQVRNVQNRQPKLRLPGVTMTRRRCRQGGRGLFLHNTLKRPKTLAGYKHLFLPPKNVRSSSVLVSSPRQWQAHTTLLPPSRWEESKPRFWLRPPTRANLKSIYTLRLQRLNQLRHRALTSKKFHVQTQQVSNVRRRVSSVLQRVRASSIKGHLLGVQSVHANVGAYAILERHASVCTGAVSVPAINISSTVACNVLSASSVPTMQQKVAGLWYSRSARKMLDRERAFIAWTQQLSTRKRRWSYPRVNGVPVPRRRVSFKAERERIRQNSNLLLRNLPQRKYIDYGAVKLQALLGSAGASGFKRIRRVHRAHTVFSRWWYPTKQAVPFAHPFSRRSLSAKHHRRGYLLRANFSQGSDLNGAMSSLQSTVTEHKFPGRVIPWRNFNFRRPRRGASPSTLQRWTAKMFTGRTPTKPLSGAATVLKRTSREVRALETFFSSSKVWGCHSWQTLDPHLIRNLSNQLFSIVLNRIPVALWVALRKNTSSSEKYADVQHQLILQFRQWLRKQQLTAGLTSELVIRSQSFVLGAVASMLVTPETAVTQTQQVAAQHISLRNLGFGRKVSKKHSRFLTLRELPRIELLANSVNNPKALQHSVLKKHWLRGAERLLQKSQLGYIPPSRSRYTATSSIAFGRQRIRFPASGRRKGSYESLLHAFTKRVCPARLRRASSLSFKRVTSRVRGDFRWNLLTAVNSCGLIRRRVLAHRLSQVAYLSSAWRKLIAYRAAAGAGVTMSAVSKRRFAALPVMALFVEAQTQAVTQGSRWRHSMHAVRAGILRRALRRRRDDRIFSDLYKATLSRKAPRDQAPATWKLRRAKKRKLSGRAGPWSQRGLFTRAPSKISWTLRHLSATGPCIDSLSAQPITVLPSGEAVSTVATNTRRNKRAFLGFTIETAMKNGRRLRHKKRDSQKRQRGYKRRRALSVRAVMCRIRHWSERKSSRRLLHFGLQKRRAYVKRFVQALRSATSSAMQGWSFRPTHTARSRLRRFKAQIPMSSAEITKLKSLNTRSLYKQFALRTALFRRARRKLLHRKSRLMRLAYRTRGSAALTAKALLVAKKKVRAKVRSLQVGVAGQLVATTTALSVISPLFFQRPVTVAAKSRGAKNKAVLANITSKESRYKVTAQYAESLLEFIPAFISHMLSKKSDIGCNRITYRNAQYLIRNIYWSLRVYLNVDPFDSKFELREQKPAARVQLAEAITELAATQRTEQPQRMLLRHRFQPGRVPLALNTARFRGDWLRAFFPEKHALYQEDSEDYGLFLFKTRDIRRLRIGRAGMTTWRTAHSGISHETRARQVLTLRYSRATPRFETLLQTLRRSPQREQSPCISRVMLHDSFFYRHHSTYAHRSVALSTRWLHRKKRFVSFDATWRTIAPVDAVTARRVILTHVEARGKTCYVASTRPAMSTSFIDSRFVRAKSPRSRQYMLRVPTSITSLSKVDRFSQLHSFRRLTKLLAGAGRHTTPMWTRHRRRSTFEVTSLQQQKVVVQNRRECQARHLRASLRARHSGGLQPSLVVKTNLLASRTLPVVDSRVQRHLVSGVTLQKLRGIAYCGRRSLLYTGLKRRAGVTNAATSTYQQSKLLRQATIRLTRRVRAKRRTCFKRLRFSVRNFSLAFVRRHSSTLLPKKLFFGSLTKQGAALGRRFGGVHSAAAPRPVKVKFFKSSAGLQVVRRVNFAVACAKRTRDRRQTPFDSYRPRLWNKLTLRWMKKFRIGRYWIRDTSRWLRDPWLSQIVACDMSLRPDSTGGELRSRDQQVGEYVAEVDDMGRDIPEEKAAFRERHALSVRKVTTNKVCGVQPVVAAPLASHRLYISRLARRKPVPAMWLANYEYRDAIREHKEEKAKSRKQKDEEELDRVKEYWARKSANLPEEKPRRAPLKHPANLWLPKVIWSEIQRRVRKFEWRESDEVFFRPGFRTAFRFYPSERNRAPWLEHLMYTRATYSTRLHEFRRWQYPREQKKYKWLQRVRKSLYPNKLVRYIKGRRWPQLRRYNQKLHYTLFNLPDRGAARRHFKKLNHRSRPQVSGFISASAGLTNRLDLLLLQLGVAPSIYWARIVAPFCLLRVNGVRVDNPAYLLQPGDIIQPEWDTIARFQHYFKPQLRRREAYQRRNRASTSFYPSSIEYYRGTRTLLYRHAPAETDLRRSSRLQPNYFRWFKLDSI